MTMTEPLKVYELAKELGMDSITLLDKLKELSIAVKSHMSDLSPADVETVRNHFTKPKAPAAKGVKTAKTAKTTATAKPATMKTATTKTAAAKTTRTTKKKGTEAETPPPVARKAGATVIRRRAKGGEAEITKDVETVTDAATSAAAATTPAVEQGTEFTPEASAPEPVGETRTEPTAAQLTGSGLKMPSLLGARKEGLTAKNTGSILTIIKQEPRKAPLVTPRVQPRVTPAGPAGARGDTGIINLGKEAIARMAEEELNFKKKGPGARGERERSPTDVKVSDYRAKKELVFLPKKKKVPINREVKATQITTPAAHKRVIRIENAVSVSELAQRMGIKTGQIIKKLVGMGVMATVNQILDLDTATLLATEFGFEIENVAFKEESVIKITEDKPEEMRPRAPIVTVMGHVDHGKTSLLDAIRSANVAAGEAGGITQHIGAYTVAVPIPNGKAGETKQITFIDTPGHEAFTMMRARGANATDIVVLVVAADDGVMPQTREAIDHARAASVPIIVAVNKIDKPSANPDRVLKDLASLDLLAEEWGGQTILARVSATQGTGIKELLESILLQAEVLDLKANPNRPAEGIVLEAKLDRNRGPAVNILVKKGKMKVGDFVVVGSYCGRVRALTSHKGELLKEIGPSHAAELLGLNEVPTAGDAFNVLSNEAEARELAEFRAQKNKATTGTVKTSKMSLEELFSKVQAGEMKELPIILKTDVYGSAEAIKDSLTKLATEKVKVKVIHASTGGVTESDIMLATASSAIVIGFNVRPETKALQLAESEKIEVKSYSIIYELLDDVKKAMGGLLDKKAVEKYLGRSEVRETFNVPKLGTIAGCAVVDGKITRGCQVRLLRDSRVIYTGKLASLRRFKDDAKEVAQGYECGMGIENFNDIKQGDVIEAFMIEMIEQALTDVADSAQSSKKETPKEASR